VTSGLRFLFVGATWKGSSARSLCHALTDLDGLLVDEIGEDHYLPHYKAKWLRGVNRLLRHWQEAELEQEINTKLKAGGFDVLMVYKGSGVGSRVINHAQVSGVLTVNMFPDYSPHAYGSQLRDAIGQYELVISTKPFHPARWRSTYGYSNRCVFVPHGFDPAVHLWPDLPAAQVFDVVLALTWRPEYDRLLRAFAKCMRGEGLRVGVAGSGWRQRSSGFPTEWVFPGPLHGRAYGEWLRNGRIAIAPVNREVLIKGTRYPGDEDTTRTYELAAAHCFFLHRKTDYVASVYDARTEVPVWETPQDLAELVRYYLPREQDRRVMAAAAHARAVPAYSISKRAEQILEHVTTALRRRTGKHK
jgi:spore maturation protein CgeB